MWLKIDDTWHTHRKVRLAGKDGRALWIAAACMCARASTDLIVDELALSDAAHNADVKQYQKAAEKLVEVGLWHTSRSKCGDCEPTPKGAYRFHDWWEYQPTRDESRIPIKTLRWRRRKALQRDRELCERIVKRDKGKCRYCGIRVDWNDRRGNKGGTYDHVDPDGDNSMRNVVVACRGCNIAKADRTPQEAGMVLIELGQGQKNPAEAKSPIGQVSCGDGPGFLLADPAPARLPVSVSPRFKGNNGNGNGAKL